MAVGALFGGSLSAFAHLATPAHGAKHHKHGKTHRGKRRANTRRDRERKHHKLNTPSHDQESAPASEASNRARKPSSNTQADKPQGPISCALQYFQGSNVDFDEARSRHLSVDRPEADMVDVKFFAALNTINGCAAASNLQIKVYSAYRSFDVNSKKSVSKSKHVAGHAIDMWIQDLGKPSNRCVWQECPRGGCLGAEPIYRAAVDTKGRDNQGHTTVCYPGDGDLWVSDPLTGACKSIARPGECTPQPGIAASDPDFQRRVREFIACNEQAGVRWGGRFTREYRDNLSEFDPNKPINCSANQKCCNPDTGKCVECKAPHDDPSVVCYPRCKNDPWITCGKGPGYKGYDPVHFDDGIEAEYEARKLATSGASQFLIAQAKRTGRAGSPSNPLPDCPDQQTCDLTTGKCKCDDPNFEACREACCDPCSTCDGQKCVPKPCPDGKSCCVENGKGVCVDLAVTDTHCGACHNICTSGYCADRQCHECAMSADGQTRLRTCFGTCTDTRCDPDNCGICGFKCGNLLFFTQGKPRCVNGSCQACPDGQGQCGMEAYLGGPIGTGSPVGGGWAGCDRLRPDPTVRSDGSLTCVSPIGPGRPYRVCGQGPNQNRPPAICCNQCESCVEGTCVIKSGIPWCTNCLPGAGSPPKSCCGDCDDRAGGICVPACQS